jgi:protein involved in polysaccharide export with SLBB domain
MSFSPNKLLNDWEILLTVLRSNEAGLPGIAPYRMALERALARAQAARGMRDTLQVTLQDTNLRLRESLGTGADAAACLRNYLKKAFGTTVADLLREELVLTPKVEKKGGKKAKKV